MSSENVGSLLSRRALVDHRPSQRGLALTSFVLSANETDKISQGAWREERDCAFTETMIVLDLDYEQIRPTPWHGQHHAVAEADQHPWCMAAPEDAAHATPLTTGGTLLRHDREARTAQCNIRCSLSLG